MREFPISIWVYTFCYNNAIILPFIIDYWKQYASKVIVYDNYSTDDSVSILSQYNWIEIRHYNSNDTYDPNLIQSMKNSIYKEAIGKADYVQVSDIDEVLCANEYLIERLTDAKQNNILYFKSKYYNMMISKFPTYNPNLLLHNYNGVRSLHNLHITNKIILFKPELQIQLVDYQNNYIIQDCFADEFEYINVLHAKLVGFEEYSNLQALYLSRLTTDYLDNNYVYKYGSAPSQCISIFNSYMQQTYTYRNRLLRNNIFEIKADHTDIKPELLVNKTIIWDYVNLKIEDSKGKKCVIIIPIFNQILMANEIKSIQQIISVFGEKWDIVLVGSSRLRFEVFNKQFNYKFGNLGIDEYYLISKANYSELMETKQFYQQFSDYKYMLTLSSTCWIFKDDIKKFITLGFDYVGTPIKKNKDIKYDVMGDGMISFRNIENFIMACDNITEEDRKDKYSCKDGLFFSITMKKKLKSDFDEGTIEAGYRFCINSDPEYWFEQSKGKIPMICGDWSKNQEFWKDYIEAIDEDEENNIISENSINSNILICIFNYRHDENAKRWLKLLSLHFDVYVLDSGNDHVEPEFIQFPNIYYSGLWNEMKKLATNSRYEWSGIITSDIEIDDENANKLIEKLKWLKTTKNIGCWTVLGDLKGHSNRYVYAKYNNQYYRTFEGFFMFINDTILSKQPYVDLSINTLGYGLDFLSCYISNRSGYINVVDEDIYIFHPKEKGYNRQTASQQSKNYQKLIRQKYYSDYVIDGIEYSNKQIQYEKEIIKKSKKCIYTCITGNYDKLKEFKKDEGWDYICFTDQNIQSLTWNIRPIPNDLNKYSQVKRQRLIKILSYKYLSEYDEVLWIDANIAPIKNINEFIKIIYNDSPIIFKQHPIRDCLYAEMDECIKRKKDTKENIETIREKYLLENVPTHIGMFETNVFYRNNKNKDIQLLMNMWANELIQGSHRDQLSLNYCIWKLNIKNIIGVYSPTIFSTYFSIEKHNKK